MANLIQSPTDLDPKGNNYEFYVFQKVVDNELSGRFFVRTKSSIPEWAAMIQGMKFSPDGSGSFSGWNDLKMKGWEEIN